MPMNAESSSDIAASEINQALGLNPVWDRVGIAASTLCIAHCLALPALLPIAAAAGVSWLLAPATEWFLLLTTLLFAAVVLLRGGKHHHHYSPLVLAAMGGVLYAAKESLGHDFETLFVVAGGCLIVSAHLWNLRLCRSCPPAESKS